MTDGGYTMTEAWNLQLQAKVERLEALLAAAQAQEWRPIESAPTKGESFILLWCPEDESTWLARWQGDEWYGVDELGLTRRGHSLGADAVTGWFVSHWRPLPPPPLRRGRASLRVMKRRTP